MTLAILVGLAVLLFAASAFAGGKNVVTAQYIFEWSPNVPPDLEAMIARASSETGVAVERIKAILYIESRGDPRAVNPGDPSYGIAQMQLPIARYYGARVVTAEELLSDVDFAVSLCARFLADLQKKLAPRFLFGEWAQAYNLGETKFRKGTRNSQYGARVKLVTGGAVFLGPGQLAEAFRG